MFEQLPAGLPTPAAAASTAATAIASTTAATAAEATTAAASSATAAAEPTAFGTRAGLVHDQIAAAQIRAIQRSDGLFGLAAIGHFHECEASRTARVAVRHHVNRSHFAVNLEGATNLVFCGRKVEIPYVQTFHARSSSRNRKRASVRRKEKDREGSLRLVSLA
jgi:hypothetical protein